MNSALAASWRRWLEYMVEAKQVDKALVYMLNHALGASWRRWMEFVEEVEEQRAAARKALRCFSHSVRMMQP